MLNEQSGQKAQEIQGRTKFGQFPDASETDTDFWGMFSLSEANMFNVHGFMGLTTALKNKDKSLGAWPCLMLKNY